MNRTRALAALLCLAAVSACDETNRITEIDGPETGGARIKFFNFGINAPGVNFYAEETKMSAVGSTTGVESTSGIAIATVGGAAVSGGGFYSSIEPGSHLLTGRIAATIDKNRTIATLTTTLVDGVSYSYYMSGLYDAVAKTSDGFIVPDPYPADIDLTAAYVRFVHASHNAAPLQLILRASAPSTLVDTVGGLVTYKNAGAFEQVVPGSYTLGVRYAATAADAFSRTPAIGFLAGHYYTITMRGDITIVAATNVFRPFLDNTANR